MATGKTKKQFSKLTIRFEKGSSVAESIDAMRAALPGTLNRGILEAIHLGARPALAALGERLQCSADSIRTKPNSTPTRRSRTHRAEVLPNAGDAPQNSPAERTADGPVEPVLPVKPAMSLDRKKFFERMARFAAPSRDEDQG